MKPGDFFPCSCGLGRVASSQCAAQLSFSCFSARLSGLGCVRSLIRIIVMLFPSVSPLRIVRTQIRINPTKPVIHPLLVTIMIRSVRLNLMNITTTTALVAAQLG